MMTVVMGDLENSIHTCKRKLQGTGREIDHWFEDQMVKDIILDIDSCITVSPRIFSNEWFGDCSRTELSGGTVGLISILKDSEERVYDSAIFGDNCYTWLAKLSFLTDFTLCLVHPVSFIGDEPVDGIGSDGARLTTCREVWDWYVTNDSEL